MTFKRPEMTFKASEYFLIMNVDYFVSISSNLLYYTTILPCNTNVLENPRVFFGSWPLRPRKWPLELQKKMTPYFILFSINFSLNWTYVSRINMQFPRNHIYCHKTYTSDFHRVSTVCAFPHCHVTFVLLWMANMRRHLTQNKFPSCPMWDSNPQPSNLQL